jgi:opacity protein-like surface antigen
MEYTMIPRSITPAVLLITLMASTVAAQDVSTHALVDRPASELARRSSGTLAVIQSRPQGAFGRNVGLGYGVDGAYLFRLDEKGIWSIRVGAGIVSYGDESRRTTLSESVGGRVSVNVKTNNYIVPMSIGAQLARPAGLFRPYVNAGIGGLAFFTESHLEGTDDHRAFASTTNHSSIAPSWTAGGGIYMPVYNGKTSVQLDLGMQYVGGGRARYLAPGSIRDLPGARIAVTPLESATHLLLIRFGARIGS